MSWRVVVVTNRCKLECKLGYLICRGEEVKKVFISEISSLIIESTAVSLTAALLSELINSKVNIIFCDEKHNPQSQLNALYGRHDCSGQLKRQLDWSDESKQKIWTEIVRLKIMQQQLFLEEIQAANSQTLLGYATSIEEGDMNNREGLAAKVYFNELFGLKFKRGDNTFINSALNYGYAILLSAFNREIVGMGFNTQLGLAHRNEYNFYNLSCDLMEPFRIIIDRFVFCSNEEMTPDFKHSICDILNHRVKFNGENCTVVSAIGDYCKRVFEALDLGDISKIKSYEL